MPNMGDKDLRVAISNPILSERTLRYKRNMFLAAALASIHTYGKIDSNKFKLSGAEYTLPNADTTVGFVILAILLYLLFGCYRHTVGDRAMWLVQFDIGDLKYLRINPKDFETSVWGTDSAFGLALYKEFRAKQRYNAVFEFYSPLVLATLAWLALAVDMGMNVMGMFGGN